MWRSYVSRVRGNPVKVPFNWKARGYCIWSVYANFHGFFSVVFDCYFLDNKILFWFLSKSHGSLASNLNFSYSTLEYTFKKAMIWRDVHSLKDGLFHHGSCYLSMQYTEKSEKYWPWLFRTCFNTITRKWSIFTVRRHFI